MILISNLNKFFANQQVLKNVTLHIPEKTVYALLGPNGSGKSTLLKCILNLTLPEEGSKIELNGSSSETLLDREEISYMPQIPAFPRNLKVKEIISFLQTLSKRNPVFKEELIKELGISDFYDKTFGALSGGMKQKVNILQCFMYESNIYIVDEPTASLDPHISYYLKKLMLQRKEMGHTILFTSHIMSEVEELADRMGILVSGELIAEDKPDLFISKNGASNLEDAVRGFWEKRANE